ncbi:MAG: peptide deformylase [Candidatus Spechtbacteria bacterium RIFCSPLOWO2_12_FULL_38_22]|uniref:Peptide deformylase n=1 Tax=Candidatus Spechtbacteria bacterium RIFCSPLOWO2_12_FULL_38_22 TaxID=1802165 RepID=A0A1G2HHI9_9BACT|nr:MAG: peptide deformylase [Candidatus Spechtbacteria bacterium RIFCSPHIGHO2_12_FULL_38_30]OGZ61740.1 MAG: peptide deformylase [Candidatus Spechtbacteria bacterium RIFCSPLOWO2_12_FULL_38_22]
MIKKVIQNPNPLLYKKTENITDFKDKNLRQLIKDMKDTLLEQDGLGLAAPQIGISKAVFVIPPDYAPKVRTLSIPLSLFSPLFPTTYINPRIVGYLGVKEEWEEGCLSIRGVYYKIRRYNEVVLEAQAENGKKFSITTKGLLAKVFQHETDHLNGTLITNRLHEK